MQVQVNIEFDQILSILKTLPSGQLKKLKAELQKESKNTPKGVDLKSLLLSGPVATSKQLDVITNNKKAINQWRTN